jgi:hypothetical protein
MDAPASPAGLAELKEYLGTFRVRWHRPAGAAAPERGMTGRLTERPTKPCETIAQAMPGTSEPRVPACLTTRPWAADDLPRQRVQQRRAEAALGDGVLGRDAPGVPTAGNASGGVGRQDSGTFGKGGHHQIAVSGCDSDPQASGAVAMRRSWPKA